VCNYCAQHKEANRDKSIHLVAGFGGDRGRVYQSETDLLVTLRPEDVPAALGYLRAALEATEDGTLEGGDE